MKQYTGNIFADENDIYMALHSNKNKITDLTLRKIAFERGMIYSSSLNRNELIEQISQLPFGYSQVKKLTDKLVPKINRDQYSIKRISKNFDLRSLDNIVDAVVENRPQGIGNEVIVGERSVGTYYVEIDYVDFDFTKGRFQQKKSHSGYIAFIESTGHISVHYTYTEKIDEILGSIIEMYRARVSNTMEGQDSDLSFLASSRERSLFIERVIKNNDSIFLGSEKIRVSKTLTGLSLQNNEDDSDSELDDLDCELNDPDEIEPELINETKLLKVINNASFDGHNLDDIDDINKFYNAGYFPSRVKWRHKSKRLKNSPIVIIELAFNERHLGKDLKFRILGKHAVDDKGQEGARMSINGAEFDDTMFYMEKILFDSYEMIDKTAPAEITRPIESDRGDA